MKIFIISVEQGEYSERELWVELAFQNPVDVQEYIRFAEMNQQDIVDWDKRKRFFIEEIELLDHLPNYNWVTREFDI